MVHVTTPTSIAIDGNQGRKIFVFDRVFGEDIDQEGVWSYLQDSIDSFIQGYNVSVLAYGQSGAGKSYTMGTAGLGEPEENMGRSQLLYSPSLRCATSDLPFADDGTVLVDHSSIELELLFTGLTH